MVSRVLTFPCGRCVSWTLLGAIWHMKSTNMLERLNEQIKRRTHVVRIFPNRGSCLRLVRALATEMHENWIEATRHLNTTFLREQKNESLRNAGV